MLTWLRDRDIEFPPIESALDDPNGLLAAGGDLRPERLLEAYRHGIFPWYEEGQPILWWSPDPRAVLIPSQIHISKSLRKTLRQGMFKVTIDTAFSDVIQECAKLTADRRGTWITNEMINAYLKLHRMGIAHSFEVWFQDQLVGGLYGLNMGNLFFGESMFSRVPDASKVAFVYLAKQLEKWGFKLIDCQVPNPHLASLGACKIPRAQFKEYLVNFLDRPSHAAPWYLDWSFDAD